MLSPLGLHTCTMCCATYLEGLKPTGFLPSKPEPTILPKTCMKDMYTARPHPQLPCLGRMDVRLGIRTPWPTAPEAGWQYGMIRPIAWVWLYPTATVRSLLMPSCLGHSRTCLRVRAPGATIMYAAGAGSRHVAPRGSLACMQTDAGGAGSTSTSRA